MLHIVYALSIVHFARTLISAIHKYPEQPILTKLSHLPCATPQQIVLHLLMHDHAVWNAQTSAAALHQHAPTLCRKIIATICNVIITYMSTAHAVQQQTVRPEHTATEE